MLKSVIQEDCFFYCDGNKDIPFEERRICAMCVECWQRIGQPKLWYWDGKEKGYGDYDLKCSMEGCDNIIHQRKDQYANNDEEQEASTSD